MRARAAGSRGSVLAHVLVTAVIVAVISSGILRMVMMRYTGTARVHESSRNTRNAHGSFNVLMSAWNQSSGGAVCSDVGGFTCTGTPGTCGCTCNSSTPGMGRVRTCLSGGQCVVRACSAGFASCPCP